MHQAYFACLSILFFAVLLINLSHTVLYGQAVTFALATGLRRRFYLFFGWVFGCLLFLVAIILPLWMASNFLSRPSGNPELLALGLASLSLILAVLTSMRISNCTRSIYQAKNVWEGHAGEQFESQVHRTIDGVFVPSGYLWSIATAGVQVSGIAMAMSSPDMSQFSMEARSPDVGQANGVFIQGTFALWSVLYAREYLFNPGRNIAKLCTEYYTEMNSSLSIWHVGISRWRTRDHLRGFRIADAIIRSLSGLKDRVASEDFEKIDESYRRIANGLRIRSIRTEVNEFDDRYAELCVAAIWLAIQDHPLEASKKAEEIAQGVNPEESRPSRVAKYLSHTDLFIDRYSKTLLALLGVALSIYLIGSGRMSILVEMLVQVVAR